jgi:hypothetical protein
MQTQRLSKPATYIVDFDGTIAHFDGGWPHVDGCRVIKKTQQSLLAAESLGHHIVIMTARPETMRQRLHNWLLDNGIVFHQLVMGVTSGLRVVVNDRKPDGTDTALAINLTRNEGWEAHER